MEELVAQARELGKKIAQHPRAQQFFAAAKAVAEDRDAQALLKQFQEQVNRIRALEAAGRPIEPEDKRKLVECETKVASNEKLKEMMKHQANYLEMMHRISAAIDEAVK